MSADQSVSRRVVALFMEKGLSQRLIGEFAGVPVSEISRIHTGQREFKANELARLSAAAEIPSGALFLLCEPAPQAAKAWAEAAEYLVRLLNRETNQILDRFCDQAMGRKSSSSGNSGMAA